MADRLLEIVTQSRSRSAYRAANYYGGPMRYIVMAIILVLSCFGLSTAQAVDPFERESLRGLPGVLLLIESTDPDVRADGL